MPAGKSVARKTSGSCEFAVPETGVSIREPSGFRFFQEIVVSSEVFQKSAMGKDIASANAAQEDSFVGVIEESGVVEWSHARYPKEKTKRLMLQSEKTTRQSSDKTGNINPIHEAIV